MYWNLSELPSVCENVIVNASTLNIISAFISLIEPVKTFVLHPVENVNTVEQAGQAERREKQRTRRNKEHSVRRNKEHSVRRNKEQWTAAMSLLLWPIKKKLLHRLMVQSIK